jgi:ribosome maturation factor RimP
MRSREISDLIGEIVANEGAELVDFECGGSSHRPVLRAYVDVPGGTTIEACAELSRKIEARLDASDRVGERYTLEVSSPGLDRPLRTRRDFDRLRGRPIVVAMRREVAGRRELVGTLEAVGGEEGEAFWLLLRPEAMEEPLRITADDIAFARPHLRW